MNCYDCGTPEGKKHRQGCRQFYKMGERWDINLNGTELTATAKPDEMSQYIAERVQALTHTLHAREEQLFFESIPESDLLLLFQKTEQELKRRGLK